MKERRLRLFVSFGQRTVRVGQICQISKCSTSMSVLSVLLLILNYTARTTSGRAMDTELRHLSIFPLRRRRVRGH